MMTSPPSPSPSPPSGGALSSRTLDRRGARRARLAAKVTVTVGARLVEAVAADVSTGGMRVIAAGQVFVGEPVSLVFLVNGDIVCATGSVRWCHRTRRGLFSFGIAFSALEEDGPSIVSGYCGEHLA